MRLYRHLILCGALAAAASPARAQFATVINVPPSPAPTGLDPNTQLNLGPGGMLPSFFRAGLPFGVNANLELNITGGVVQRGAEAYNGARFNVSGGALGAGMRAYNGSQLTLSGGEFFLNGAPVPGLDVEGQMASLDFPADSILTGTLSDGSPIALSSEGGDQLAPGALRLKRTVVPAVGPVNLIASSDPLGYGLRGGQTLTVDAGGAVPSYYTAAPGSTINLLPGGTIGSDLELVGATLNVDGGEVDYYASVLDGSVVNLSQGKIGSFVRIGTGGVVNMTGGVLDYSPLVDGGLLKVSGGTVGDNFYVYRGRVELSGGGVQDELPLYENSELVMSGGRVGGGIYADASRVTMTGGITSRAAVNVGSQFEYSGGEITDQLYSLAGGQFTIVGGDFRINGQAVADAVAVGDVAAVNIPEGAVVSGTLASGVPFAFSSSDLRRFNVGSGDRIEDGTLRLQVSALPSIGPPVLTASSSGPLAGVRAGQALTVDAPGVIGENFHAGEGSAVNVITGGRVGPNFEAAGAIVNITGGTIDYEFDVFSDTTVNLSAGEIGFGMDVIHGGTVNVAGGSVGDYPMIHSGGRMNLSGGTIGENLWVQGGGLLTMTGGAVGKAMFVLPGGSIDVQGGAVGEQLNLRGLATVHGGALSSVSITEDGDLNLNGGRVTGDIYVGAEARLHVGGGVIQGNIEALAGSSVDITGGALEGRFTAGNSDIVIAGGKLGRFFDASPEATVHVSGGSLGTRFTPRGPVTISGANFEVNGVPVQGLDSVGDESAPVVIEFGQALTGTLADGTPLALSPDEGDGGGYPITLRLAALPAIGPAVINASSDPLPLGIRAQQRLVVDAGAVVSRDFSAGRGSTVDVLPGGDIGSNFEAAGATVNITGGSVGEYFGAFDDTVVNISAGSIGVNFQAHRGSVVNISGGAVGGPNTGPAFYALQGSTVNISGGVVTGFYAYDQTTVNISGGELRGGGLLILPDVEARVSGGRFEGPLTVYYNAEASFSGGEFETSLQAYNGSKLELFVTIASLAGAPLDLEIGEPFALGARDVQLTGRFAEGEAFRFDLASVLNYTADADYFSPSATLILTRVFHPGDYDGSGVVDDGDYPVWLAAMTSGDLAADGNYDRLVTEADLQVWQERYGTNYRIIPEPRALFLAVVGTLALAACRRAS